jgi:dTDP-4-amino-4,6-dideoxygalactose transaminase
VTFNVTAETIAARISPRTKAVVATHLFGNPVRHEDIVALAKEKGLAVVEDCAQAFLARTAASSWHARHARLLQPATGQAHHVR